MLVGEVVGEVRWGWLMIGRLAAAGGDAVMHSTYARMQRRGEDKEQKEEELKGGKRQEGKRRGR